MGGGLSERGRCVCACVCVYVAVARQRRGEYTKGKTKRERSKAKAKEGGSWYDTKWLSFFFSRNRGRFDLLYALFGCNDGTGRGGVRGRMGKVEGLELVHPCVGRVASWLVLFDFLRNCHGSCGLAGNPTSLRMVIGSCAVMCFFLSLVLKLLTAHTGASGEGEGGGKASVSSYFSPQ